MGEIFGAILDAIGDSIKEWARKTGKPCRITVCPADPGAHLYWCRLLRSS